MTVILPYFKMPHPLLNLYIWSQLYIHVVTKIPLWKRKDTLLIHSVKRFPTAYPYPEAQLSLGTEPLDLPLYKGGVTISLTLPLLIHLNAAAYQSVTTDPCPRQTAFWPALKTGQWDAKIWSLGEEKRTISHFKGKSMYAFCLTLKSVLVSLFL